LRRKLNRREETPEWMANTVERGFFLPIHAKYTRGFIRSTPNIPGYSSTVHQIYQGIHPQYTKYTRVFNHSTLNILGDSSTVLYTKYTRGFIHSTPNIPGDSSTVHQIY
jgi:hypothetical protein